MGGMAANLTTPNRRTGRYYSSSARACARPTRPAPAASARHCKHLPGLLLTQGRPGRSRLLVFAARERTLGDQPSRPAVPTDDSQPGTGDNAPLAQPLGNGVYLIDTLYLRPALQRATWWSTRPCRLRRHGAAPAAPRLLAALDELGIAREQVTTCS